MTSIIKQIVDDRIVRQLFIPEDNSHKGENGKLLIVAGSEKYHGALLLAVEIASRLVDLVYVCSNSENNKLIKSLKSKTAEFITIKREDLLEFNCEFDAVLIGPGMDNKSENAKFINQIIQNFVDVKIVLDADALKQVDPALLSDNCVVTPHHKEFEILFNSAPNTDSAVLAARFGGVIVLKGREDIIATKDQVWINSSGNAGMTKGGTGDVLAGLIAALACKNDIITASLVGVFLNGKAGDELQKSQSIYYNASDLVKQIPLLLKKYEDKTS